MDFDPRDCDSRDEERFAATRERDDRGAVERDYERDDDGSRSSVRRASAEAGATPANRIRAIALLTPAMTAAGQTVSARTARARLRSTRRVHAPSQPAART